YNVSYDKGDIRVYDLLLNIFQKDNIDAVIHFAANSLVGVWMEKPLKYFDYNVYGTQVLLQAMHEANVKTIVFSSTAATYGDAETMPITEETPPNPTNAYGETEIII